MKPAEDREIILRGRAVDAKVERGLAGELADARGPDGLAPGGTDDHYARRRREAVIETSLVVAVGADGRRQESGAERGKRIHQPG